MQGRGKAAKIAVATRFFKNESGSILRHCARHTAVLRAMVCTPGER